MGSQHPAAQDAGFPYNIFLCYTFSVDNKHQIWRHWARNLHRWGLAEAAATLLGAAGPVRIVFAQAAYLGQPFVDPLLPHNEVHVLAELLENSGDTDSFIALLREAENS